MKNRQALPPAGFYMKIRIIFAIIKHNIIPIAVGSNAETRVHFRLPVSFLL